MYCASFKTNIFTLRKHAIAVLKAMKEGIVNDENTFVNFLVEKFGYVFRPGVPIEIDNMRVYIDAQNQGEASMAANIHMIKGLEVKAALVIASRQTELLKWLETDRTIRDSDGSDVPRLGYVAFSRAQHFLCIGCLERISEETMARLTSLRVRLIPVEISEED